METVIAMKPAVATERSRESAALTPPGALASADFERFSAFLLEVHASAQTRTPRAFCDGLFEQMARQIRFDSAMIGTSRYGAQGTELISVQVHRLPTAAILDHRDIRDLDVVGAAASEFPGHAIVHRLGSAQYRSHPWQRLAGYCRKYGIGNVLCTAIADPCSGLQIFMRLHRSEHLDYFAARDREWHQLAMPHIAVALDASIAASLREHARADSVATEELAHADADGTVRRAGARFTARLRAEWPDFDGVRLPPLIRDPIVARPTGPMQIRASMVICDIRPADCGWIIAARARSRLDRLSAQERRVIERYANGRTHRDIAIDIGIAPATVRRHLQRAYERLDIHSKVELMRLISG
jgi:DNA-binding CsgD family transcriptional regulator